MPPTRGGTVTEKIPLYKQHSPLLHSPMGADLLVSFSEASSLSFTVEGCLWECMEYDTCRIALNGGEKFDCIKGYVRNDREMEECSMLYLAKCGIKGRDLREKDVYRRINVLYSMLA